MIEEELLLSPLSNVFIVLFGGGKEKKQGTPGYTHSLSNVSSSTNCPDFLLQLSRFYCSTA